MVKWELYPPCQEVLWPLLRIRRKDESSMQYAMKVFEYEQQEQFRAYFF